MKHTWHLTFEQLLHLVDNYTVSPKKLHHFIFKSLRQMKLYFSNFWYTCTSINLEQNGVKIANLS